MSVEDGGMTLSRHPSNRAIMTENGNNYDMPVGEGKLNVRLQILQGLLDSMGDATSAKVNSLRQTIRRNK
jgi:hypothetical protein